MKKIWIILLLFPFMLKAYTEDVISPLQIAIYERDV